MKKWVSLFLFINLVNINAQELEKRIYRAIDNFTTHKTIESLTKLTSQEREFELKVYTKQENLALVILQCNKAYYLKENNQLFKAIDTYEKAWRRFDKEKLLNYNIIEFCLKPLGNLYIKTQSYVNAEAIIKHYIFIAEKEGNRIQKNAGIINLCKLYQTLNKHREVVRIVSEVLQENNINDIQKEKLKNIKNNSLLEITSIYEEKEVIMLDNDQSNSYLKYKNQLNKANYKEAYILFQNFKKREVENVTNLRVKVKYLLEETQLHILLREEKEAESILSTALHIFYPNVKNIDHLQLNDLYAESLLIDIFDMKAFLEDTIEKSLKYYDKSFYITDLLENKINSQEARIIFQSEKRKRSEECISLLLEKYKRTKDRKILERAFIYSNKGKASVLKNQLRKKNLLKKHPDDSLLLIEREKLKKQEKIINEIVKEHRKTNNFEKISTLKREVNLISIELKELQKEINKRYQNNDLEKKLIKSVQHKLKGRETVFVSYFYGNKYIYQFIISLEETRINSIRKTKDLEKSIVEYIQLFNSPSLINNDVVNYTNRAYSLYKELKFDEVESYKKVMLITDGLLNFIPFETLLIEDITEVFFSKMPFVVKSQNIVYNFNIDQFLKENKKEREENVLGVFPVFENTIDELKYSLDEARILENNFSGIFLKKEKATKNKFKKNIDKASVIHLSTHSESSNVMSSSYISFADDNLYLNELYTLECNANLVVLSACETGVGRLLKGEGAMSIARGFSYIGVEKLLFSLWEINDKSTSILINKFYRNYKKTGSINKANNQSKISYLKDATIENYRKSPYYWGAFVYYGSFDNIERTDKIPFIIGLFLLIVIFLSIIKQRVK